MIESKSTRFKGRFISYRAEERLTDAKRHELNKDFPGNIQKYCMGSPAGLQFRVTYSGWTKENPKEINSIGLDAIDVYIVHWDREGYSHKMFLWGFTKTDWALRNKIIGWFKEHLLSRARQEFENGETTLLASDQEIMRSRYSFRRFSDVRKEGGMIAALLYRTQALVMRDEIFNDYTVVDYGFAMDQSEKRRMEANPDFWRWVYEDSDLFGPPTYYLHFPEEDPSGRTKGLPDHQLRPEIDPVIGPHPDLYTDEEQMEWMINRATDEIKEQFEAKAQ